MGNEEKRRARAKRKKKQAARKKSAPRSTPKPPNRFKISYESANQLSQLGPLVRAVWSVPEALEAHLKAAGRAVPPPVSGFMLVDTGATRTAIASGVAEKSLGLRTTGVAKTYGAGGLHENPVYFAHFELGITDSKTGAKTTIQRESEVMGIPDLDKPIDGVTETRGGKPVRLIGLLGRDFLQAATLIYNGHEGWIEIKMNLDMIPDR